MNPHTKLVSRLICGGILAVFTVLPFANAEGRWISKQVPRLPHGVYNMGLGGTVVVSLLLDKEGRVNNVRILRTSGHSALDQLAIEAAMKWRLSPEAVLATDITQGRVELIKFRGHNHPKQLVPGGHPYWVELTQS